MFWIDINHCFSGCVMLFAVVRGFVASIWCFIITWQCRWRSARYTCLCCLTPICTCKIFLQSCSSYILQLSCQAVICVVCLSPSYFTESFLMFDWRALNLVVFFFHKCSLNVRKIESVIYHLLSVACVGGKLQQADNMHHNMHVSVLDKRQMAQWHVQSEIALMFFKNVWAT